MALLNGRPASGKTTLALHLAAAWAVRRERVIVVDASTTFDAVRWHEARIRAGLAPHFRVVPAAAQRLGHRSLSRLARRSHVIIDGPSGDSALSLPALLASDLAIIPTRPSPDDMAETLQQQRAATGISYVSAGVDNADVLAPVVALLRNAWPAPSNSTSGSRGDSDVTP